jgi:AsmA protein
MPEETEPGLSADSLSIGVQLWPLFSGNVEIDSLLVDGLFARVTGEPDTEAIDTSRMSDRELDAFYAARREMREQARASAGAGDAIALPRALNVGELQLTDARIESVAADSGEISMIEIPRFQASGLNLDGTPIPLSLELRIPAEQTMTIRVNGAIKVDQVNQQVTFDGLDIRVNGATREPLNLVTGGQVDINRQIADLNLELELGAARGTGRLRFANYESPQIDTELQLNRASPALFALAGPEAAGEASEQGAPPDGDSPLPLDALRLIDTRARLDSETPTSSARSRSAFAPWRE